MAQPDYACALIEDDHHRLLLELRPPHARHAADQLTCFGGKREDDENDKTCLLRELREELGWTPSSAEPACDLWQDDRWIARFFRCRWSGDRPQTEPESLAIWAPWSCLPGLPLSPWHRDVLLAVKQGRGHVALAVQS